MQVLLLADDFYHPGQIVIDGVRPLSQNGFLFDIITNENDFSPKMLRNYPVVLLCKMENIPKQNKQPWKTEIVQKAFVEFVENGGGLLAVHSATVPGENTDSLDQLIGCRFIKHPNACPVTVQPIKQHPVTEGVELFCETDEHYKIEIIAPDADILLASYSPPQGEENKYLEDPYHNCPAAIYPAGYVRNHGKGKVCVLTPGHTATVWNNPQFQRLLTNALMWVTDKQL